MRAFLRDNIAIVVGITLPLVVVAFFVLASYVPRAYVDPPQHDLLLLSSVGGQARPVRLDVQVSDGRLRVRAYKLDYNGNPVLPYSQNTPRLFVWSHESRSVREIPLDVPADVDAFENGAEISVPELATRRLSTELRAPDGYEYRTTGYRSGLFGIFFDGSSPRLTITKDGATVQLDVPGEVPYWGAQFLAWGVD